MIIFFQKKSRNKLCKKRVKKIIKLERLNDTLIHARLFSVTFEILFKMLVVLFCESA